MVRIGLLSDTHGFLDPKIFDHFSDCDEIWHAGDFGDLVVSEKLSKFKKLRGVYGNIDGREIRSIHPVEEIFEQEGLKIFMTHIGGYPGNYTSDVLKKIELEKPGLFICGHSHILKVLPDKKHNLLHLNPGAAGKHGFHKFRTILRFTISDGKVKEMDAVELGLRSAID